MSEQATSSKALFDTPQGTIWYLLYCKAKEESKAVMHLANQQITAFYPKVNITKVVRGKRQIVEEPLFPNYVFVQLDHEQHNFTSVRSTRGVIGFVKQGKLYQQVPEQLITLFRDCDTFEKLDASVPAKGDKVMLNNTQYNNIPAIYQEPKGENRAVLLIQLLNKPVEMIVDNKEFAKAY